MLREDRATTVDYRTGDRSDSALVVDGGIDVDGMWNALSSPRRRFVLYYLKDVKRADLEMVVARIVEREFGVPTEALTEESLHRIRVNLHHVHLPKLDRAGIVTYDPETKVIVYHDPPVSVERLLDKSASLDGFTAEE